MGKDIRAQPVVHKTEDKTAHGDTGPKAGWNQTRFVGLAMTDLDHEVHDPATHRYLSGLLISLVTQFSDLAVTHLQLPCTQIARQLSAR